VPIAAPSVLTRFRDPISSGLREATGLQSSPIYEMLRYHLGLDGSGGATGKGLRPTLCLHVCDAMGGAWADAMPAAVSLELIHNFSLIHDDIQDQDRVRHNRATVWTKWGIPQAINAGDAMFTLATLNLRELQRHFDAAVVVEAVSLLHEATREMIEGQYLDVRYEDVPAISLEQYLGMIACKTGALIRASIELGALLAGASEEERARCRAFGESMGRLFQVCDDMLGVWGLSEVTGKPVGADIERKKKSLPIVVALSTAGPEVKARLEDIYAQPSLSEGDVETVLALFEQSGIEAAIQKLADEAHQRTQQLAREVQFSTAGRDELLALVDFLLERDH
jgi:geranylgeranyl diphosphate synthase type I